MKININFVLAATFAAACLLEAQAAMIPVGPKTDSFLQYNLSNVAVNGQNLVADVTMDFSDVNLPGNREVVITPMWVNNTDTVAFEPFTVAGRGRFYYDIRNGQHTPLLYKGWGKEKGELSTQSRPLTASDVTLTTPYLPWMQNATFVLDVEELGCAYCEKNCNQYPLGMTDFVPRVYEADFVYVTPVAEAVKTREITGRAFVDFKVNQIVILPEYRNNTYELGKIIATIDSVKNDKDITVTSLHIAGTASPEGPYDNNVYLAKNRTIALKDYVQKLYSFPDGFITTSYEPVDWKGLREWLENNNLENKEAILAIVNSDIEPYARNSKIRKDFPKEYDWLWKNVYPALRHSDYTIEFNIRTYTDVAEIIEIMHTAPQKLSLSEIYLAARAQEEGSELYNEAMELAVRMYPQDTAANLNAGIAAMKRGDYALAQRYLAKAGNSPEADYAKAVCTALQGNEAEAYGMFLSLEKCSDANIAAKAAKAAEQLAAKINFKGNFTTLM
ncbi:MAG: hypothetical protein J1E95_07015 [Muribaculaceae bacterium]|nr:hypothetical protein [Muribaculaceae bacterium]